MGRTLCEIIVLHLISSLSPFQVCYTYTSFLPVQLVYTALFQIVFSFSSVADSVAGCLLRKVELRQFVRIKKTFLSYNMHF